MGIRPEELSARYPILYHMASHGAWPSIERHGLLSTFALLDLFEVAEPRRSDLLGKQRQASETLIHKVHGTAILRDQKPLSERNLTRCLINCSPAQWYLTLNQRVFFWLNRDRLITLMSAKEYAGKPHTVLTLDSAPLIARHLKCIELAHMNTGNTRPFAHPRGVETFKQPTTYPYEQRKRLNDYSAIVELTVRHSVPDVREFVTRVDHATIRNGNYRRLETMFER